MAGFVNINHYNFTAAKRNKSLVNLNLLLCSPVFKIERWFVHNIRKKTLTKVVFWKACLKGVYT